MKKARPADGPPAATPRGAHSDGGGVRDGPEGSVSIVKAKLHALVHPLFKLCTGPALAARPPGPWAESP